MPIPATHRMLPSSTACGSKHWTIVAMVTTGCADLLCKHSYEQRRGAQCVEWNPKGHPWIAAISRKAVQGMSESEAQMDQPGSIRKCSIGPSDGNLATFMAVR